MKIVKLSVSKIKESHGKLSVQTGEFNNVLPYYVRQVEDIAVQYFQRTERKK